MLNIKKLLTKVLTSKVGFAYVGNVYWWQNTWTCPNDGIATMRAVTGTSGNKAYWYAKDNTNNVIVGQINQTADGTAVSASFPCIKGHVYTTYAMDQISTAEVHYYKLTWGGVFLNKIYVNLLTPCRKAVVVC